MCTTETERLIPDNESVVEPQKFFELRCRACQSDKLYTDYKQGDRVCTNCGVVDEERIMEEGPEWKDYNELEDIVRGTVSGCRSSLIPTNDQLYLGGLQPTTLSSHIFGGNTGRSLATRKTLVATNKRMDKKMEKMHSKALMNARLALEIRKRNRRSNAEVKPEYEALVAKQEVTEKRRIESLYADKWSLSRAIKLNGAAHEVLDSESTTKEENLTPDLIKASQQLYAAYSMITRTSSKLGIPVTVQNEAVSLLCLYARRRDGLIVRGVSSVLKRKHSSGTRSSADEKEARDALREYNGTKQIGALTASIIFLVSRKLKQPRSPESICSTIVPENFSSRHLDCENEQFIKKRHLSRAIAEIKECIPEQDFSFSGSLIRSDEGTVRTQVPFDDISHRLTLPPVFDAAVRLLSELINSKYKKSDSAEIGEKLVAASVTHFLSTVGSTMKDLAVLAGKESFTQRHESDKNEHEEYRMRRVWDAWREQVSWNRSPEDVANAYGVNPKNVATFTRNSIMPLRRELLDLLMSKATEDETKSCLLSRAPLASILLGHISMVEPLLKLK